MREPKFIGLFSKRAGPGSGNNADPARDASDNDSARFSGDLQLNPMQIPIGELSGSDADKKLEPCF